MDKKLHSYLETGFKNPAIWTDEDGIKYLYCVDCGAYIGSENEMDFYSLIRKKYCDKCRKERDRKLSAQNKQRARRNKKALNQKNDLLTEENKKLREINRRLDGQVNALNGGTLADTVRKQEQEIQELKRMLNALAKKKSTNEKRTGISISGLFKRDN